MMLQRCSRCDGFVPVDSDGCPNCKSKKAAWWVRPLAFAGAGLASVTLSACYGVGCAVQVTKPDGSTEYESGTLVNLACNSTYDCNGLSPDGGPRDHDSDWQTLCADGEPLPDAGNAADGGTDAGP